MAGGYSGWWGAMKGPKERGFITYTLSPYQLKSMKGFFTHGPSNTFRRTANQVPYILPAVLLLWGVVSYGKKRSAYLHSKAGHHELE
ncbi:Cytochrome b-c1 complex subunit 8 [Smittium culicis]|uniref:Cytochrome b-c1 complex subunit 8 n=2 Tax=Smittium culicis TaxID=133412 RepID=A0A1R1YQ15_9FUNG|nr:Cytochrome b-c1 complex subunit 8 [Smittium culicis]OMJ21462.1 Cytochrome b-c1 complex subunit 8 [Smittium culicis]OMJ28987.1 Cytochrome b-c1 complex subunit 8 [Smittium culicis]